MSPPNFARGGTPLTAPHMAMGGNPLQMSPVGRMEARGLEHSGFIHSPVAGRTDQIPMSVKGGSYVLPSDVISAVGQGNSLAGAHAFGKLFNMGPYGSSLPHIATPKHALSIRQKFEAGGTPSEGKPVDIIAAGGEMVLPPEVVTKIGGGDLKNGHDVLDHMVLHIRKKNIKTLRSLKGPKKK